MDTSAPLPLWRRALAEFIGTGLLVTIVVGSGIAAQRLSPGDAGLQLLQNSLATALGLAVLIVALQPVSGAQLNPVVTLADRALGTPLAPGAIGAYLGAQIAGGAGGAVLANAMFEAPTTLSTTDRLTAGHVLGEVVATAGLVGVIFSLARTGRLTLGGRVHRGGLLVHLLDLLRQPSGHDRPAPDRHLRRDRPLLRPLVPHRPARWRRRRRRRRPPALPRPPPDRALPKVPS